MHARQIGGNGFIKRRRLVQTRHHERAKDNGHEGNGPGDAVMADEFLSAPLLGGLDEALIAHHDFPEKRQHEKRLDLIFRGR